MFNGWESTPDSLSAWGWADQGFSNLYDPDPAIFQNSWQIKIWQKKFCVWQQSTHCGFSWAPLPDIMEGLGLFQSEPFPAPSLLAITNILRNQMKSRRDLCLGIQQKVNSNRDCSPAASWIHQMQPDGVRRHEIPTSCCTSQTDHKQRPVHTTPRP